MLNLGVRYDYEETPTYTDTKPAALRGRDHGPELNFCPVEDQDDPGACFYNFSGGYHGAQPGQTYAQTLANAV